MSKTFPTFWLAFAALFVILQFFNNSNAQDITATINIDADSPRKVHVDGKFSEGRAAKNLSFLLEYANAKGLGERFSNVELHSAENRPVASRRMIAGEFLAESDFSSFSYDVDLMPRAGNSAAAHVSWLNKNGGIIMLDDLLPQLGNGIRTARINFKLPPNWKAVTSETVSTTGEFEVSDIENSVFYAGMNRREIPFLASRLILTIDGEWFVSNTEAANMAAEIFAEYTKIFGVSPSGNLVIGLTKFPNEASFGNWEADTRGRTVNIVSSDMAFKAQSLQRLHEQLRHEVFHLWLPNGVNLSGNYDWFYEGFALYQSLKMGVAVNRIRFDDVLDTLSRAYDIDRFQNQKFSLIDSSKNRWSGANTQVYARGMIVAFMCDLALLDASKGKRSVGEILRDIYSKHRPPAKAEDGNAAILAQLRRYKELAPIIDRNITGGATLDWTQLLKAAGIEAELRDQLTQLKVSDKTSGRQKDLLDKLGYNNWRKLGSGIK